jgi:ketosteroid isomerase-like protein
MKETCFVILLVSAILFTSGLAFPQTQTGSVEQELVKLENEWCEALVKQDWAFMERVLADDYTWTDPDGNVHTKADEIASIKFGQGKISSCALDDLKVRVYGDAAVITGLTTHKGIVEGKEASVQFQWTDTWVKIAGRWQCVAAHISVIPEKNLILEVAVQ